MNSLTKRNTKLGLIAIATILIVTILTMFGVGMYLLYNQKDINVAGEQSSSSFAIGGESGEGDVPIDGTAKASTYTVTFKPNGGTVSPTTQSVTYGQKYGTLPTPTKSGYAFDKWVYEYQDKYTSTETQDIELTSVTYYCFNNILRVVVCAADMVDDGIFSDDVFGDYFEIQAQIYIKVSNIPAIDSELSGAGECDENGEPMELYQHNYLAIDGSFIVPDGTYYIPVWVGIRACKYFFIDICFYEDLDNVVNAGFAPISGVGVRETTHVFTNSYTVTADSTVTVNKNHDLKAIWKTLKKPTISQISFYYTADTITLVPENFDSRYMTVSGNVNVAVGDYTMTISLKSGYVWSDGTSDGVTIPWKIIYPRITIYNEGNIAKTVYPKNKTASVFYGEISTYEISMWYPYESPEGYQFVGYYTSSSGGTKVVDANLNLVANVSGFTNSSKQWDINGNKSLYVRFELKPITITFDANRGEVIPTSKTVYFSETYGELPIPEKEGCNFEGWYVETDREVENTNWEFADDGASGLVGVGRSTSGDSVWDGYVDTWGYKNYGVTSWISSAFTSSIQAMPSSSYQAEFLTYDVVRIQVPTVYVNDAKMGAIINIFADFNVLFNSIYLEVTSVMNPLGEAGNIYAFYSADPVTSVGGHELVLIGSGGEFYAYPNGKVLCSLNAATMPDSWMGDFEYTGPGYYGGGYIFMPLALVRREGSTTSTCSFGVDYVNWNISYISDDPEEVSVDASSVVSVAEDHTLYASWSDADLVVKFDPNGGTVYPTEKTVVLNEEIGDLPTPERPGYVFGGWEYTPKKGHTLDITDQLSIDGLTARAVYTPYMVIEEISQLPIDRGYIHIYGDLTVYASEFTTVTNIDFIPQDVVSINSPELPFNLIGGKNEDIYIDIIIHFLRVEDYSDIKVVFLYGAGRAVTNEFRIVSIEGLTAEFVYTQDSSTTYVVDEDTIVRMSCNHTLIARWEDGNIWPDPSPSDQDLIYNPGEDVLLDTYYPSQMGGSGVFSYKINTTTSDCFKFKTKSNNTAVSTVTNCSEEVYLYFVGADIGTYVCSVTITDVGTNQSATIGDYIVNVKYPTLELYDSTGSTLKQTVYPRYDTTNIYDGPQSKTLATLIIPTRTGYTFLGWYTETSGGKKVINANGTLVSGVDGFTTSTGKWYQKTTPDQLYERWAVKDIDDWPEPVAGDPVIYKSMGDAEIWNFDINGGSGSIVYSIVSNGGSAFSITPTTATTTGISVKFLMASKVTAAGTYKLKLRATDAYTGKYKDSPEYSVLVIYPQLKLYDDTGETLQQTVYPKYNTTKMYTSTLGGTETSLTIPTKSGYNFLGWYTAKTGGTKVVNADETLVENVTDYTLPDSTWRLNADYPRGSSENPYELYERWEKRQLTVTFDANGGTVSPTSKTVAYNEAYGDLPTPTRVGYSFQGWTTPNLFNNSQTPDSIVGGFKYEAITEGQYAGGVKLTKSSSSTSAVFYVQFIYDDCSVLPGRTYSISVDFVTSSGSQNVSVGVGYQQHSAGIVTGVSSSNNKTNNSIYFTKTIASNATNAVSYILEFQMPLSAKIGDVFTFYNIEFREINITKSTVVGRDEDHTLVASWKENPIDGWPTPTEGNPVIYKSISDNEKTWTFDINGGSESFKYEFLSNTGDVFEITPNTAITDGTTSGITVKLLMSKVTSAGDYTFRLKATDINTGKSTESPETAYGVSVIYPQLNLYNNAGSTINQKVYLKYGTNEVYSSDQGTTPTSISTPSAREGYSFKGWYTAKTGGVQVLRADATLIPSILITGANTIYWTDANGNWNVKLDYPLGGSSNPYMLYEQWEATEVNYVVAHWKENINNDDALSYSNCTLYKTVSMTGITGQQTQAQALTLAGFTAQTFSQVTIAADGTTVVNVFYARNRYVLTLTADTGVSSVSGAGTYDYEEEVTISAVVKNGYSWSKWEKTTGTTPKVFVANTQNQTIKIGAGNVTLKATTTVNSYTITYKPNGASGSDETQSVTYNANFTTKASNTFTNPGYAFKGWSTSSGVLSGNYKKAETTYTYTTVGNTTLYAIWEEIGIDGWPTPTSGNPIIYKSIEDGPIWSFDINGGSESFIYSILTNEGDVFSLSTTSATTAGIQVNLLMSKVVAAGTYTIKMRATDAYTGNYVDSPEYSVSIIYPQLDLYDETGTTVKQTVYPKHATNVVYDGAKSEDVTEITTPTKSGYNFLGWYTAKTGGTKVINADRTLVASVSIYTLSDSTWDLTEIYSTGHSSNPYKLFERWVEKTLTVTFDANGGSVVPENKAVTYNQEYGELPVPTKIGYTFIGWFFDGDQIIESSKVATPYDHTLIAQWSVNSYNLVLKFFIDDEEVSEDVVIANNVSANLKVAGQAYNDRTSYSVNHPYGTRYNLIGVNYISGQFELLCDINEKTIVPGINVIEVKLYTIEYTVTIISSNEDYGTVEPTEVKVPYNTAITVDENTLTIGATNVIATEKPTTPEYTYSFEGWRDVVDYVTVNITITAEFDRTPNKYKVTYDATTNGGTFAGMEGFAQEVEVEYGVNVDLDSTHRYGIKDDFNFIGWSLDVNATAVLTELVMPAEDVMLFAVYGKSITISFYDLSSTDPTVIEKVIYNNNVTVSVTSPNLKDATLDHVGWNTSPNGLVSEWDENESRDVSESAIYYAVYSDDVVVEYNKNCQNGTGSVEPHSVTVFSTATGTYNIHVTGVEIVLRNNGFTNPGYEFIAWAKWSTDGNQYSENSTVRVTEDVEFFAIWEAIDYDPSWPILEGDPLIYQSMNDEKIWSFDVNGGSESFRYSFEINEENVFAIYPTTATENGFELYLLMETKVNKAKDYKFKIRVTDEYTGITKTSPEYIVSVIYPELDLYNYTGSTINQKVYPKSGTKNVYDASQGVNVSTINVPTRQGYKFLGWYTEIDGGLQVLNETGNLVSNISGFTLNDATWDMSYVYPQGAAEDPYKLYERWETQDIEYKVRHWLENIGNEDPLSFANCTLLVEEEYAGKTDTVIDVVVKDIDGFTAQLPIPEKTIAGDGSTVVDVFYIRNRYSVTLTKDVGVGTLSLNNVTDSNEVTEWFDYEQEIEASVILNAGYSWFKWELIEGSAPTEFNFATMNQTIKIGLENCVLKATTEAKGIIPPPNPGENKHLIYNPSEDVLLAIYNPAELGGSGVFDFEIISSTPEYFKLALESSLSEKINVVRSGEDKVYLYFIGAPVGIYKCKVKITDVNNGLTVTTKDYVVEVDYPTLYLYNHEDVLTNTIYPKYNTTEAYTSSKGSDIATIVVPTRDGYTFLGWYSEAGDKVINNDATLVAGVDGFTTEEGMWYQKVSPSSVYEHWVANGYTITYKPNGANGVDIVEDVSYDAVFTTLASNVFERVGYTFLGWSVNSEMLQGKYQTANQEYVYTTVGNETLYAIWKINTYSINLTYELMKGIHPTDIIIVASNCVVEDAQLSVGESTTISHTYDAETEYEITITLSETATDYSIEVEQNGTLIDCKDNTITIKWMPSENISLTVKVLEYYNIDVT